MTKQEFMAMSLPFSLNCLELQHRGDKHGEIGIFTGYELDMFNIIQDVRMPILHPLSDLTKEIAHKGETFVPIVKLGYWIDMMLDTSCGALCLDDALKLIEWHFDIDGLIRRDKAIDVNTLEVNPYK